MKKYVNIIYIAIFLALLIIPVVTMNNTPGYVSEIDNRALAEFPEPGVDDFTTGFESYLQDRIGGRNQMVNAYAVLNDKVAGELVHPLYTYGQDGYVFFKVHNNISYNDFHKTFAESVYKIQQYCEDRGAKFYFLFDPEKISVYRRYLPEGVNYNDSWVGEMLSYMDELGVHYIDSTEYLTKLSYSEDVFNVQYDAGHWNDLGCFYATNQLFKRIHEDIPAVNEMDKDMFHISTSHAETLPVSEFKISEDVPKFDLKVPFTDLTDEYADEVEVNSNYPHFHYYINNAEGAENLPRTLLFQGSYYNRGPQFLINAASECAGVHNYQNVLNVDYYFNIFRPELVVLDVAEYTVSTSYFDYETMQNLSFNPPLIDCNENAKKQIEVLKKDTDAKEEAVGVSLISGDKIDRLTIDDELKEAEFAYVLTDDTVIDLKRNADGLFFADMPHTEDISELMLLFRTADGEKFIQPLESSLDEENS